MPDVAELGRKVKRKYPGAYDDLSDADLGRKVKKKYPGAYDDFTDAPPQPGLGTLKNLALGAEQTIYGELVPSALSGLEALGAAMTGDFGPAKQVGERFGRGLIRTIGTYAPVSAGLGPAAAAQDAPIARIEAAQQAQRRGDPIYGAVEQAQRDVEAEAAQDPSRRGRITRGVGRIGTAALPAVATGIATGGSVPAMSAVSALQTLNRPEDIPLAAGLGAVPIPVGQAFRAGINSVRRALGRGAAQVIEAEAAPAAVARVRRAIGQETIPAPAQPAVSLQSVFGKLGTDNIEQIGAMIANANRRLGVKRTPAERQSSIEDYDVLRRLTREEHDALSQVLPARTFSPVAEFEQGGYSREIRDIPTSERSAQLDANLRELEQFFGGQTTAPRISAETALPAPAADFGISAATPRAASASVTGPSAAAPLDALNVAVNEAAGAVPRSGVQKAKDELLGTLGASKSLRSTADISYPLRQGALLLLRPLQWRQAGKVWKDMFRAFKTKNFDAVKEAIDTHPLAGRWDVAGLQPFPKAGEEAFARRAGSKVSEIVSKAPIVKQSGQAYDAAAATQRVQAFEQYARLIDKAGLSAEDALKADKAAAQWINIATGRGSLGKRLDKAMEGLNFFFYSPRYVASRLNVFNPAMYIRNASSPGGRVVLKQQMSDLMQFAGVVATTMYLAKQAGADVGLIPNSPDFLKIRVGNRRYDPLAGLQQVMRLIYRVGADIGRAGRGEKPKPGQTAIDIGETFLNYKLSPPAGVFRDFINQRTVDKKPFTAGRAVADLTAPMQWADFVEAYQKEAWGGVLKAAPGVIGVGAQNYEQTPVDAAIEKAQPLFTELQRLNKRVADLRQKEGEAPDVFNARVQQFGSNYTTYGLRLLQHPRFQQAPDNIKAAALDRLNERAKGITHRQFAFPELELDAGLLIDAAEAAAAAAAKKGSAQ